MKGGLKDDLVVKSTDSSSRGPRFNSELHCKTQPSITPVPGHLINTKKEHGI